MLVSDPFGNGLRAVPLSTGWILTRLGLSSLYTIWY